MFWSETRDVSRCFLRQSRGAFGVGGTGYLARFSSSVGNGSKSHGLPFSFCSDTTLKCCCAVSLPHAPLPLSCRCPNSSPALACVWASPHPFPLRGRGLWGRGLFFYFLGFYFPFSLFLLFYLFAALATRPVHLYTLSHFASWGQISVAGVTIAREVFEHLPAQIGTVEMGVDFGGADVLMSEHGLDGG